MFVANRDLWPLARSGSRVYIPAGSSLAPHDNGTLHQIVPGGGGSISTVNYTTEDWTPAEITTAENNVTAAMQWWKDTFKKEFPRAADPGWLFPPCSS